MSKEKDNKSTQIGLHSVRSIIGNPDQLSLFQDQHIKFSELYGVKLENAIDQFGVELTDVQMRVMEGILRGFTETNYKGNISPEDKENIAREKYSGKLPDTYKYLLEIPRLRATQKQIIDWAGLSMGIGDKERALEALYQLGTKQYCFYYDRLAIGTNGEPEKDKNGNWKKESVMAIDTLFTIKVVHDEPSKERNNLENGAIIEKKGQGNIKYYEITPSPVFLDQRETYFMLIPYKWRDEVQALFGRKRVSAYVFRFLFYLRFQYEMRRRPSNKQQRPYQIRATPEELAIAIKMPKSVYRGQKERMNKVLDEAFWVAKTLGYIVDYERTNTVDILTLRDEKFSVAQVGAVEKVLGDNPSASVSALFDLFHKKKKELNHYHETPTWKDKDEQLQEFSLMIKKEKRSPEDIGELIKWALSQKYWCTRVSTPYELRHHFDKAWTEMNANKKQHKTSADPSENRTLSEKLEKVISNARKDIVCFPLKDCLEIGKKGSVHQEMLSYNSKTFKKDLEYILEKLQIPVDIYSSLFS